VTASQTGVILFHLFTFVQLASGKRHASISGLRGHAASYSDPNIRSSGQAWQLTQSAATLRAW
jgi:hypothetical protein